MSDFRALHVLSPAWACDQRVPTPSGESHLTRRGHRAAGKCLGVTANGVRPIPTKLPNSSPDSVCISTLYYLRSQQCITVTLSLIVSNRVITATALIDCGATSSFIDSAYTRLHSIPVRAKHSPIAVRVVDGRTLPPITNETFPVSTALDSSFRDEMIFNITSSPNHNIILGMPWLTHHNPVIDWTNRTVQPRLSLQLAVEQPTTVIPLASDPSQQRAECLSELTPGPSPPAPIPAFSPINSETPLIAMIDAQSLADEVTADDQCFLIDGHWSNTEDPTTERPPPTLPDQYLEFADVFDKHKSDSLPEHRKFDCTIDLREGTEPPFARLYGLSQREQLALKSYLEDNVKKGFIRPSTSPAGAPVLFVKKKDGSLRLCIDYRGLNAVTIRNRYPLPLIDQLLAQLNTGKIFTKIDLRGAYHQVRIRSGDEWKTAFRTPYGLFEYAVMPFGLTNAPSAFQYFMNDTFHEYLDQFVIIYLDDILIFSPNETVHTRHVRLVLQKLREAKLFAKFEKCQFHSSEVEFLGYLVSVDGLRIDPAKIESITSWQAPDNVQQLQVFWNLLTFIGSSLLHFLRSPPP
jgi:hypothetical protein